MRLTSLSSCIFLSLLIALPVYEIAGVSVVTPLDVHGESRGTSTTPDTNLTSSTSANEIVLGAAICGSTCSAGDGFTGLSDSYGNEAEFNIVTGTQDTLFSQASNNRADSIATLTETGSIGQTNVGNAYAADQNFVKEPNPYPDATRYGVRNVIPSITPAAVGLTANCRTGEQWFRSPLRVRSRMAMV